MQKGSKNHISLFQNYLHFIDKINADPFAHIKDIPCRKRPTRCLMRKKVLNIINNVYSLIEKSNQESKSRQESF